MTIMKVKCPLHLTTTALDAEMCAYGWIFDINEKWKPIKKQLPKVTDVSIHFKVCRCKKHCLKNCACGILSCTEICVYKKNVKTPVFI